MCIKEPDRLCHMQSHTSTTDIVKYESDQLILEQHSLSYTTYISSYGTDMKSRWHRPTVCFTKY